MPTIGLVSCGKRKRERACYARDLYCGRLFELSRDYVAKRCARWFILSARYGLLAPKRIIEPYDLTLLDFTPAQVTVWAASTWAALREELSAGDTILSLATKPYIEPLRPSLVAAGVATDEPLLRAGLYARLAWLCAASSASGS